jgi:hypothetical protein
MLANVDLTSTNTNFQIYQVPSGQTATVTIRFCNRTAGNVHVQLIFSSTNSPGNSNYAVYNAVIYPNDVYTEPGVVLNAGDYIFAQTDTLGVNTLVWGFSQ